MISEFLTNNSVISDTQFGFRRKCNTSLAVFTLVADLLKSFHNKIYCICLLKYLRKAFDTVCKCKNVCLKDENVRY